MDREGRSRSEKKLVEESLLKVRSIQARSEFVNFIYEELISGRKSFFSFWSNLPNVDNNRYLDAYFEANLLTLPEKSYYKKNAITKDLKSLRAKIDCMVVSCLPFH